MAAPFFSVIVPVYNVEKYLDRCIESILAQDFPDFELILVDDGARDRCPQMCDAWAAKDSRIRVIHKENAGLGMARNSGLEQAEGAYVLFVDSDDYIRQGLFSACKRKIVETEADAVFFGLSRLDEKGNALVTLKPNPAEMVMDSPNRIKNELLADFIARNPHSGRKSNLRVSVCCSCLKKETVESNHLRFVSERQYISEDLYFFIELFNYLNKVTILDDWYYCYCQNHGSLTFSYKADRFERLEQFYKAADSLANGYGYDGEVQLRLKESFIANTLGCLKMEAGNTNKAGILKTYKRIRHISSNRLLHEAFSVYPSVYFKTTWKIIKWCVLNNHFLIVYGCLLAQYIRRGV